MPESGVSSERLILASDFGLRIPGLFTSRYFGFAPAR